jgi:DNA-binding winged helix-turn-helix (wHTH) protein
MDPANIHVLVFELRKVLGEGCIETQARRGYRLAAGVIERPRPVRRLPSAPQGAATPAATPKARFLRRGRLSSALLAAVIGGLVLLAAASGGFPSAGT